MKVGCLTRIIRSPVLLMTGFTIVVCLVFLFAVNMLLRNITSTTELMSDEIGKSLDATQAVHLDNVRASLRLVRSMAFDPLFNLDAKQLNDILLQIKTDKAVKSAFFLDTGENVLADGLDVEEIPLLGKPLPKEFQIKPDTSENHFAVRGGDLVYSHVFDDQGDPIGRLQVRFSLAKIRDIERRFSEASDAVIRQKKRSAVWIVACAILAISFALLVIFFVFRRMTRKFTAFVTDLDKGSDHVARVSAAISESGGTLRTGVREQNDALSEMAARMTEISESAQKNMDNARKTDRHMAQTHDVIDSARRIQGELNAAMMTIRSENEEVTKILSVINDIAFQTRLLALNASIEAARAGETGAGFAVVADEVGNLAIRVEKAADQINTLTEHAKKSMKNGETLGIQTDKAFEEIWESIAREKELVAGISDSSEDQIKGLERVRESLFQMGHINKRNMDGSEKFADFAEHLRTQSERLVRRTRELEELSGIRR